MLPPPPQYLNFQARLETSSGAIVPDGNYNVEFKLYSTATGGTAEWTEDYTYNSGSGQCNGPLGSNDCRVHVANGYLSVNLGSITVFPNTINWDQQQYLTMNIGGTVGSGTITWDGEMNPRLPLTSVPYAFQAKSAEVLNITQGGTNQTLQFASTDTTQQSFVLPDMGAAGTYDLLTGPTGTGTTSVGVDLQSSTPGTVQTGSFNISGTGIVGSSTLATSALQAASGGTGATYTVQAINSSTSASSAALYGSGTSGYGIEGVSGNATNAGAAGIYGLQNGTGTTWVYGVEGVVSANNTGAGSAGVYGLNNGAGVGVYGDSTSSIGVYGYSGSYAGVFGQSQTGSSGLFQSNSSSNSSPTLVTTQQGTTSTADLFEAQNSSGSSLVSIGATGELSINGGATVSNGTISTSSGYEWDNGGGTVSSLSATLADSPHTIGNLLTVNVVILTNGDAVTGVSGGGVSTWHAVKSYNDTNSPNYDYTTLWEGTVTAAGSNTITVTFSSGSNGAYEEVVAQEFTAGLGSGTQWTVTASGTSTGGTTSASFPSLTSSQNGQLYWGYVVCPNGVGSAGSTSGFTYVPTTQGNLIAYNTNLSAGTGYAPTATCSAAGYTGIAAIIGTSTSLYVNGGDTLISVNATSALQVQNTAGSVILNADTTDNTITLGNGSSTINLDGIVAPFTSGTISAIEPGTTSTPETWHTITLASGWSTVGGQPNPSYRLLPDGMVEITGTATHASFSSATALAPSGAIPTGYDPTYTEQFVSAATPGDASIEITTSGGINCEPPSSGTTYCRFDGTYPLGL